MTRDEYYCRADELFASDKIDRAVYNAILDQADTFCEPEELQEVCCDGAEGLWLYR